MVVLLIASVASAGCHGSWTCVTRFDGSQPGGLDDFGFGAGILGDSTANDVWFVMNRNVEVPTDTATPTYLAYQFEAGTPVSAVTSCPERTT